MVSLWAGLVVPGHTGEQARGVGGTDGSDSPDTLFLWDRYIKAFVGLFRSRFYSVVQIVILFPGIRLNRSLHSRYFDGSGRYERCSSGLPASRNVARDFG